MAPVGACAAAPPAATAGMASLRSKAGNGRRLEPAARARRLEREAEDGAVGGGGSAYLSPASGTRRRHRVRGDGEEDGEGARGPKKEATGARWDRRLSSVWEP